MSAIDFDVAILGAGPGGLSAAARAAQRGMSHVLLEAAEQHANTIQQYQRRKHIMAEPSVLPLRSDIVFAAGRREEILANWQDGIRRSKINVRYRAEVVKITHSADAFSISLKSGAVIRARRVILALGIQGNPRRLGVPGDDHACIQTTLECADDHAGETILIVGAGDSAIENALALCRDNRVIVVNRGDGFPRAKDANALRIGKAIEGKTLCCEYGASVLRVEDVAARPGERAACRVVIKTRTGEVAHVCHRIITRLGAIAPRRFIEPIGVRYVAADADALPELSPRYETSVPGLYMIGALAGYPLIKQALNQGYEVIEHLSGHAVEPADNAILASKLSAVPFGHDVDATLELIRERVRLFQGINPLALREQVMASTVRVLEAGNEIYLRGEYLHSVFNVLQGEVYLYAPDAPRLTLTPGQFLGASSLISGRPSEATAIAGPDCVLLETPQRMLKKLMRSELPVRRLVDRVYILRNLKFLLSKTKPETIHKLARSARIHRLEPGQALFNEGDPVDRVYLVRRGSVTLSRRTGEKETAIAYCAAGGIVDSVGETSAQSSRAVTARATVAAEAVSLDHAIFTRELRDDPDLRMQLQAQRAEQLAQYAHMQARPAAGDIVAFLMSNGVGEATNILVIDETLCIGCDQCETACASTHQGVSRLDRRAGPSFAALHLPTSCRHCEHPHCMSDCPADAIHKMANGEVSIDDTCIGCGNCEENCPYGVIQMADLPVSASFIDRLLRRPAPEPVKTAVKCDMCVGRKSGPACVDACPTGAAIRIHAEDAVQLAARRTASR